jgi:hypothetical protein
MKFITLCIFILASAVVTNSIDFKYEWRSVIKFYVLESFKNNVPKNEIIAQNIYNKLLFVYGNEAPSRPTVYNWVNRFKDGETSIEDEHGERGRPITAFTDENIELAEQMISEDPHITVSLYLY